MFCGIIRTDTLRENCFWSGFCSKISETNMKAFEWRGNQCSREAEARLKVANSRNSERISLKRSYHQDRAWVNRRPSVQQSEMLWFLGIRATIQGTKNKMCWEKSWAIKTALKSCFLLMVCWHFAHNKWPKNARELLSGQNKIWHFKS